MKFNPTDRIRLTDCCGAYSTYHDDILCCKSCWNEVGPGEGDGTEVVMPDGTTKFAYTLADLIKDQANGSR